MTSERVQRQINRLLDEAEQALTRRDWQKVKEFASDVLALDTSNADAHAFLAAAERALGAAPAPTAPATVGATHAPSLPTPAPAPTLPTSFAGGRYQVKRFLGEGGKKRVYLAHDTLLDRDVAFALIKTEALDDASRSRILREAQAMGRLGDHPNIMQVFDLGHEPGLAPGGQAYMVLPLMPGGDVEGVIEKAQDHRMPLERVLKVGIEVSRGLEFAHSKGIIHRDLKPGNIWLTQEGTAKIGDFGLALPMNRSRLTTEGMMVGTVSYMPPEQAMGGDVTPQADLYSLGCMMYEMVTGRPPFVGDGPVAIIGQHLNTPPVAPSWHRPDCPPALESIILRLLEKDPIKRPKSARDVLAALEHTDLSAPVGAMRESPSANPLEGLARGVFVDRTAEMAAGRAMVDEALSGRAGFLLINGELGIGKTRLAEEICTYASLRGATVLWGVSLPDQGAPAYWPWVQALRTYVRSRDADRLRSELGTAGPEVAKVVSDLRERLPNLPPPTPGNPAEERFRLFDAVATFLRNASASQPLVVVLDNLHFADQPTLLLAQFLLQEAGDARLLIIGTYRDLETGRRHPHTQVLAQLAQARRFRRMTLTGLSKEDVGRLMEAITGEVAPPALLGRVYEATGGMPLFVEETVRLMAQQGRLGTGSSSWAVPQSVREVIGQRLDLLSEDANQVLTLAAVAGREFDLALLRELTGQVEDPLIKLLDEALAARLVEEVEGAVGRYAFVHGVTRQVLTADLSAPRQARLHAQVGEALEKIYGKEAAKHAAELAYHFGQAAALSGDQEKAVRYAVGAAQAADAAYGYEEAISQYEAALGLMDDTGNEFGQDRIALVRGLATAQRYAYLTPQAFRNYRRAMRLAQQRGDRQQVAELALEQALSGIIPIGIIAATLTLGLEAIPDPDSELAALMHAHLVWPLTVLRRGEEAQRHQKQAWELTQRHKYKGVEVALAIYACNEAVADLRLQEMPALVEQMERAQHAVGPAFSLRMPSGTQGAGWPMWLGEAAQALREVQPRLVQARRARDPVYAANILASIAEIHASQGHWEEMRHSLDSAREWIGDEPNGTCEIAGAVLADARGDLTEACALLSSGNALQRRIHMAPIGSAGSSVSHSALERRAGHGEKADEFYSLALGELEAGPEALQAATAGWVVAHTLLSLEAAARRDAVTMARCRAVLEPYADLVADQRTMWAPVAIRRALGVMAVAEEHWEEAVGHLEQAVRFCQEKGLVVELAHARLALSDACKGRNAQGDRRRAATLADEALADYRRLGMPLYVQDALARRELLKA